jgi:hypothetical protein
VLHFGWLVGISLFCLLKSYRPRGAGSLAVVSSPKGCQVKFG